MRRCARNAIDSSTATSCICGRAPYDAARQFRWELLVDPGAAAPPGTRRRVAIRYAILDRERESVRPLRARPSRQSATRISPLDNTYDNLTIAGDWTACGFNEGCVEAAVMSGRLAAHAIPMARAGRHRRLRSPLIDWPRGGETSWRKALKAKLSERPRTRRAGTSRSPNRSGSEHIKRNANSRTRRPPRSPGFGDCPAGDQ